MKFTHIWCVRRSFLRFLPFKACLAITVIPVVRRRQGCTLRFRLLSTRRWLAPRKSSRSTFFSAIVYDLRSLHPGTCLNTKTSRAFRWKRAFSTCISKFASLWLCSWWPPKSLSRPCLVYEANFLSTPSGTVDKCTILTPFPRRHLALIYCLDQPIRQGGETKTDKQRTKFEYSSEFGINCRRGRDAVKLTAMQIHKGNHRNLFSSRLKISFTTVDLLVSPWNWSNLPKAIIPKSLSKVRTWKFVLY